MTITQNFSRQLAARLKERDWSDRELARAIGVSSTTASKWSRGESLPRDEHMDELCRLFGTTYSEFVANPENPPPDPVIDWMKKQLSAAGYEVVPKKS